MANLRTADEIHQTALGAPFTNVPVVHAIEAAAREGKFFCRLDNTSLSREDHDQLLRKGFTVSSGSSFSEGERKTWVEVKW